MGNRPLHRSRQGRFSILEFWGIARGKAVEARELGNVHSELYPIGNLELEIEPANKSVKFTSDYELRPSFLQNHDFAGGDSGWTGFEFIIAVRKGAGFAAMHGNSGKQERYIQQAVSVEKSRQAMMVEVKFAHGSNVRVNERLRRGRPGICLEDTIIRGWSNLLPHGRGLGNERLPFPLFTVACRICSGTGTFQRIMSMITRVISR